MTPQQIEEARKKVLAINKRLAAVAIEMEAIAQLLSEAQQQLDEGMITSQIEK